MSVTVTPAELAFVLDLASKANAPVGLIVSNHDVLSRFVALANSRGDIGVLPEKNPVVESEVGLLP